MNRCQNCKGIFLSPRVEEKELLKYYPDDFYNKNMNSKSIYKNDFRKNCKKYNYISSFKPGRLLDVGCRHGSFLKFLVPFGWDAEGFEFSDTIPNPFNCKISYNDIHQYDDERFDVVTMWAVLEHLYHPNEYISHIHNILKEDALLVVQVPKFNSYSARFLYHDDVPRHVSAFTSKWIVHYLAQFGFKVISINTKCTIWYGGFDTTFRYIFNRLLNKSVNEALYAIYNEKEGRNSRAWRIEFKIAKKVDKLLRLLNYWGQMTILLKKVKK